MSNISSASGVPNQSGSGMTIGIIIAVCCCILLLTVIGLYVGDILCDMGSWAGMSCPDQEPLSPTDVTSPPAQESSPPPPPTSSADVTSPPVDTPPVDTPPVGTPPVETPPRQTLLESATAIQVPAVDPATLSGTWSAAITPTDPTGPTIKYSFTMDVNLDSTWSTVAGSAYPVFTHAGGSPDFYINNGGAAGATWGADATNGVLIYQATVGGPGGQQMQVYKNSFTPGTGYKNIMVVCDGTDVKYYVNGVLDTNIFAASDRTNKTGVKWNTGTWAWAGLNQGGSIPTGKSKIRNFYWWSDKALSDAERTTLLGNAATAGSLGASTYMPQPLSMGVSGYTKEGYMVLY